MSGSWQHPNSVLQRIEAMIAKRRDGACDLCGRRRPTAAERFCRACLTWLRRLSQFLEINGGAGDQADSSARSTPTPDVSLLLEVSDLPASSLDYDTILEQIVRLAVPAIADWSALYAFDQRGDLARLELASVDPAQEPALAELLQSEAFYGSAESWVARILAGGTPELLAEVSAALSSEQSLAVPSVDLVRRLGLYSAMALPLYARERPLGVLLLGLAHSKRRYGPEDLSFATEFARRAATAIEHVLLYKEAREAQAMQDNFLSVLAHELKTPVTSLHGFAQLLILQLQRGDPFESGRLQRALEAIDRQSQRLSHLISQLLDVNQIESGYLRLSPRLFDLARLTRAIVDEIQQQTSRHSIVLETSATLEVVADPFRLEQALVNLLDNAIKFSPQGGLVALQVALTGAGDIRVAVTDQGIGIPPEHQARIFERFYQVDPGGQYGGIGLGLYISRRVAELHGGTLVVETPREGGARFVLTLPADPSKQGASAPGAPAVTSDRRR